MHAYQQQGIHHFLLCYVGRQSGHVSRLTTSQGGQDGDDACQRVKDFGLAAAGTPVCLNLELRTFEAAPSASLDYAGAWCAAVRAGRPAARRVREPWPAAGAARAGGKPDWVWIASWIQNTPAADSDPHEATGVPDDQWPQHGQRAWQYAGRIARKLGIAGGWLALYALNRAVIGPDPDVLRPGEVLRLP